MAITAVREVWRGETWSDSKDGSREYLMQFEVLSDDPEESPATIRAHPDIPAQWSVYPDDAAAICVDRQGRRDDRSRLLHVVECRFRWSPEDARDDDEPDPIEREPRIRWTSQSLMIPVIRDNTGKAITNSAGDYPDPPPEHEIIRWIVNIQFNATVIPANIRQYKGAVNNAAITIDGEPIAAERAKIVGLDISEKQVENETEFRSITLAVEIRDDNDESFDLEILDQGLRTKEPSSGEPIDILISDEEGKLQRPSAPVMLDGHGQKLDNPNPSTAVFLPYTFANLKDLTIFPGID